MDPLLAGRPLHRTDPVGPVDPGPVVRLVEATGGSAASIRTDRLPVASTSMWTRRPHPAPGDVPLLLHFEVKEALGFDHAVVVEHRSRVVRATRVGDRIGSHQVLRTVGPTRLTPLGSGRTWEVDLVLFDADGELVQTETYRAFGYRPSPRSAGANGSAGSGRASGAARAPGWSERSIGAAASACRVWAPVHHDPVAARRAGLPGVIACTQHLVAIVERAACEAAGRERGSGPAAAVSDVVLRMRRPVVAGPQPEVCVEVSPGGGRTPGGHRGGRPSLRVALRQAGELCCEASVAVGR